MFAITLLAEKDTMVELQHLKFSDFNQLCHRFDDKDDKGRDLYQNMLEKYVLDFIKVFRPKIISGELAVPDTLHHVTNPGFELQEIKAGKVPRYGAYFQIERSLAHSMLFTHSYYFERKIERKVTHTAEEIYAFLVQTTQALAVKHIPEDLLEFKYVFGESLEAECFECGARIKLRVSDWDNLVEGYDFKFVEYDHDAPKGGPYFVDIKPCECHGIKHWTDRITFPSGKVYAADWFRILNFTKIVDKVEDKHKYSLNSRLGCYKITRLLATSLNFAKFQVGNTCPTVFANKSTIVFGRDLEDDNGRTIKGCKNTYKDKGYVCTDLWAACFIDHEVLANLLLEHNSSMTKEEIETAIEKWKKTSGEHIVELAVEPGEYVMRYDGTSEIFHTNFERSAEFEGIRVMGLIEKVINNE